MSERSDCLHGSIRPMFIGFARHGPVMALACEWCGHLERGEYRPNVAVWLLTGRQAAHELHDVKASG